MPSLFYEGFYWRESYQLIKIYCQERCPWRTTMSSCKTIAEPSSWKPQWSNSRREWLSRARETPARWSSCKAMDPTSTEMPMDGSITPDTSSTASVDPSAVPAASATPSKSKATAPSSPKPPFLSTTCFTQQHLLRLHPRIPRRRWTGEGPRYHEAQLHRTHHLVSPQTRSHHLQPPSDLHYP